MTLQEQNVIWLIFLPIQCIYIGFSGVPKERKSKNWQGDKRMFDCFAEEHLRLPITKTAPCQKAHAFRKRHSIRHVAAKRGAFNQGTETPRHLPSFYLPTFHRSEGREEASAPSPGADSIRG